ncbi:MAG: glycosyltransferase family 4 protein [Blastochloris viridis]|uniref:Glycosyltransferase family 4 protein n=1 Tax=Blastochloris viridis TaxID=1079 RepID=A0A6N4RAX6_BLAVI|nr:MAG: glycosyltransferase family 4 protein [Blastochloris viridis]
MISIPDLIKTNRHYFHKLVASARGCKSPDKQAALCSQAAIFAVRNPCGIFNSWPLEETLLKLADGIASPMASQPEAESFLHVLTRAYASGGHTRVAERWINAAPASGRHDVVLLSQGDRPVPKTLEAATHGKHGKVMHLNAGLHLAKARQLRSLASNYQHIILHVHMYDILPLLAFGTPHFPRPITLYNHADHLFWTGVSIADNVVNFRSLATYINTEFRHIPAERNQLLPLPVTQPPTPLLREHRQNLKAELGLPEDSQVILTMASPYKYAAIEHIDFLATAESILTHNPRAFLIAIGPSLKNPTWQAASQRTGGRIKALGRLPYTEVDRYLTLADLALDSFPFASLTAMLDIARHKIPCLTLHTPVNSYDAFTRAGIVCATPQEVAQRALQELANPSPSTLFPIIEQESLPQGFARHVETQQKALQKTHKVYSFTTDNRSHPTEMELFIGLNHHANISGLKAKVALGIQKSIHKLLRILPLRLIPAPVYSRLESYGIL